ncbi:MAG: glycosyltransferase [Nitrospirae bacterium]|nr:glycosyltransferase [Nitrospirota bacterium]
MEYLKKNLEALRKSNPEIAELLSGSTNENSELAIVNSRDGLPSLKVNNIALHSLYAPVKEAQGWAEYNRENIKKAGVIAIFGFGLGYHISELCKITDKEIIVFEPRTNILMAALEVSDLRDVLQRVRIITDIKMPETGKKFLILEHRPSVSLNPEYFDEIRKNLSALEISSRGLRIMVVGPIYGGSLPVARYCAQALRNLGHKVDFIDNSIYKKAFLDIPKITANKAHQEQLREMFVSFASEAMIARCMEFKPHLIFALAQAPLSIASLQKLKDNNIPTAFWFVEDFRFRDYWERIAPFYNCFFTIQKGGFLDKLKKQGIKNSHYLPLAASLDFHIETEISAEDTAKYGSDVSFVGAGYFNRREFLTGLIDFDLKIWGTEWDMSSPLGRFVQKDCEWIETEEMVKIFNATKININLHSSAYRKGVDPYGDFVNPRTFEIASCGGFQLVDRRAELPELFKVNEEIVCFDGIDDLRFKVRHYLDNPGERQEIVQAGKKRILKEHTYELRMKEMITFVLKNGYEFPKWDSGKNDIESMIEGADENSELGKYLSQFANEASVNLDSIVRQIRKGEGSFSKTEKIFLLMDEIEKKYAEKC